MQGLTGGAFPLPMPNVTNIEIYEGKRLRLRPHQGRSHDPVAHQAGEGGVIGHYATSRVMECWSCSGLSYALCDDTLANQVFTYAVRKQANQLQIPPGRQGADSE